MRLKAKNWHFFNVNRKYYRTSWGCFFFLIAFLAFNPAPLLTILLPLQKFRNKPVISSTLGCKVRPLYPQITDGGCWCQITKLSQITGLRQESPREYPRVWAGTTVPTWVRIPVIALWTIRSWPFLENNGIFGCGYTWHLRLQTSSKVTTHHPLPTLVLWAWNTWFSIRLRHREGLGFAEVAQLDRQPCAAAALSEWGQGSKM